jgi:hypothetical protein
MSQTQNAPFYMRYTAKTSEDAVNLGSFTFTIKVEVPHAQTSKANALTFSRYVHFVFFGQIANSSENLLPAFDNLYMQKQLPLSVQKCINKSLDEICDKYKLDNQNNLEVFWAKDQTEALQYERLAKEQMALDIFTNSTAAKQARKLGVDAQAGLSKVSYID